MDNLASNKSHIPCQSWAVQNGWSTASTQGPLLNPLPSSQHLILGPSSSQRPPYDHLQESSQHCMSDLSAAHRSALYKASLISSNPSSNALFANTAVPSTSHRISFAQQTSHTSPMLLTANQGKNTPLLSLPQTNQAPQLCRPQLLPLPSHNHNLYKAPFQPPSSNQSLPNGLLPVSLPSCGQHVSTSAAAFQGTNVTFSGVAGYTHSRASSTSQERSQWIPPSHCREAVTESIPDAAAHPKNKPSKEDTISPPANNERQRLVLLHQRAQLLQQVAELDKLLESINPEESRDGKSPHSAIQSPPLMDDSAQCEQPKTSDAEQLQLSAGKSECQSHLSSDCSSPAYHDDQSEDDSVLTAESEKEEKDFGESSDESDPDFFPNSDGDFSDFLSDPDWDSSDESSHSSPAAVETPLPPDEKEMKKEKTASPQRKICPTNPMNSFKTVVLPSLSSKMGRVYDRRNYCLFCTKPLSKMSRHLERIHSDKPEVAAVFQYPKYSKDRQKIWNRLINQGNFAHNKEVLKTGMGHLVSRKRPNTTQKAQDFLHCLYCRGLFIKKALYRHMKSCPEKVGKEDEPEVGRKRLALRCVLETLDDLGISDGFKDILSPMLFDDVTQTIMADEIILQYGEDLFIQHGSNPKKHDYIRQNLRQIARLLLEAQNTTPLKKLKDFFLPSSFPHVVSAVNDLAGYNPETKAYNHPSLAIKLGYNLQKTCGIVEGNAERCGDASAAESARSFLAVYQEKWNALVSAGALTSIQETKLEKEKKVPFAQDVKRLNSHMEDVHLQAEKKLRDATSAENYAALATVILARTVPLGPLNRVEMMITESELTESAEPDKIETSVDDLNQTCPPLGPLNRVEMCQKHHLVCTAISSLDNCIQCLGPVSFKWLGYECRVCSGVWHKSCLKRISNDNQDPSQFLDQISDECMSDEEYIPELETEDDDDSDASIHIKPSQLKARRIPVKPVLPNIGTSQGSDTSIPVVSSSSKGYPPVADHMVSNAAETSNSPKDSSKEKCKVELKQQVTHLTMTRKNYCYVCGKPQSKISRHLKTHNTHAEIIKAFSLPEHSKERKILVEKMRNKGNFKHNTAVLQDGTGPLKVKRKPKAKALAGKFIHCMYCQGMYIRKELWRHARRCPFKPENAELNREPGRTKVLALAEAQENAFCQQISSGVWKILSVMKQDEVASVVRNDLSIINLAESLYNKHGQDPTKYEYIRQKIREVGRLLLCLRTDFSVHNLEEAVKPANFQKVVQAVKRVSGFDEEKHSYATPSLALKLGHTLQKICDIVHCRALMAEDEELIKSTDMFKKLYTTKWSEVVSHCALNTLSDAKYNKPSTLPFTEDVQMLHRHLEKSAETAFSNLEKASTQNYAQLAKCTLAQIIVFNRRSAGEVSKMRLKSFHERDDTKLHKDVAMGLSKTEQRLCNYFSRIEIMGKRGRKVAVLLTPSMLDALSLLTSKRLDCGVCATNVFLFAIPNSMSHYRGQDCLRVHASKCGAKHPEYLRSTQLRKHVATLSQVLNLKNNELDQVADFLGHDIRVHRDFYRLPVPTTQLPKISKLLLSMEKGNLSSMQGKSLDEIEVEDEIALSDAEDQDSGSESDDGRSAGRASECGTSEPVDAASNSTFTKHVNEFEDSAGKVPSVSSTVNETAPLSEGKDAGSRRGTKTAWSKAEVAAVMRHFQSHIRKGHLATKNECSHCKLVEGPVLEQRTVQNVRDFVRNRGIAEKRQSQKL